MQVQLKIPQGTTGENCQSKAATDKKIAIIWSEKELID